MTLSSGTRLGPYEITAAIGAGGMGEVYRATDSKLKREVAIKVLPAAFVADKERLARFEREAQLLAQLHHPHIASIFGLEDSGESPALVMELVEGPTLAERLAEGPIPVDEALPIARQIAEALEYAHEHGIIHRDLKPANIKLTHLGGDEQVKILDFGLAKAMDPSSGVGGAASSVDLSRSPTITLGGTVQGMILGTAGYMAPEQARGAAVDKRADIWAFGVVVYEILSGKRLFAGESVPDTLAGVLKGEIDLESLPDDVPAALRRLLRRCLQRNPKNRLRDIGEARIALDAIAGGDIEVTPSSPSVARRGVSLPIFIAALVIALAVGGLATWRWLASSNSSSAVSPRVTEFSISTADLSWRWPRAFELSPHGERLAWETRSGDSARTLWVRDLDDRTPRKVVSENDLGVPIWSPDGKELAFDAGGKLWRIRATGGQPEIICDLPKLAKVPGRFILAGAWMPDDSILFAAWRGGIYRVPARGGEPELYIPIDPKVEVDFHRILVLPDGKSLLLAVHRQHDAKSSDTSFELFRDRRRTKIGSGGNPALIETANMYLYPAGYSEGVLALIDEDSGELWGVPFDAEKGVFTGKRFQIVPRVGMASLASDGTLAYVLPRERPGEVVRIDRRGSEAATLGQPHSQLAQAAMSPDGSRLALVLGHDELWMDDLARGTLTRLDKAQGIRNVQWGLDGQTIYYSTLDGASEIRRIAANPSAQPETLYRNKEQVMLTPFLAPDGKGMLIRTASFQLSQQQGLYWVPFTADGKLGKWKLLFNGFEVVGRLSPNGRMLAYSKTVGDKRQAFLTTFPSLEQTIQLSSKEAGSPRWRPDGSAVYYLADGSMTEVDVGFNHSGRLTASREKFLFDVGKRGLSTPGWSVAPDGKGFLFIKPLATKEESEIVVVRNGLQRAEQSQP